MAQQEAQPISALEGFFAKDPASLKVKLRHFMADGPDSLHCVFDFDHTLTAGKIPGENAGTWDILDEFLPPEGRRQHQQIFQSFRAKELDGQLTVNESQEAWSKTLDLVCSYRINLQSTEQTFQDIVNLRSGVKILFDLCRQLKIPTVILSAGIKPVIELLARKHAIQPDIILSTELETAADGRVVSWKRETLIHMMNKREMGHHELNALRKHRRNVLLVGDTLDDAAMVTGTDDVLRVRVVDPRRDERLDLQMCIEKSFEAGFDLVVEHSLKPLSDLLVDLFINSNLGRRI